MLNELKVWLDGNEQWLLFMTVGSLVFFVGSLASIPVLVARAPADYFVRDHPHRTGASWARVITRNAIGAVLLFMGVLMLVLPGQGVLTVLMALTLLDFPGKRHALQKIVARKNVRAALVWLRKRAHKPPFEFPEHHGSDGP